MWRTIWNFVDWRFFIALALLVGVGAAVQGSLAAGQERDRAISGWAADRAVWDAERRNASAERQRLLQGQQDLEDKYDRLIRWLNGQNIRVPDEILTGRTTVIVENDDNDDDSDDAGDTRRTPTVRPPAPTPRPSPTKGGGGTNDGALKSGDTGRGPEHSKGRGSPHRGA